MIHDVDRLLERIVKRDALSGSAVELVFDAPTKDWVARRSGPTVDLYLYDIREDRERRGGPWEDRRDADGRVTGRRVPPRRFRLSYLVTAWTQRPEDEHRLLSALLAGFARSPMLKPEELEGPLADAGVPVYLDIGHSSGQDRSLAEIWSSLGGELKAALDVIVTAPLVIELDAPAGPPVLVPPTLTVGTADGPRETVSRRRPGAASHSTGAPAPAGAGGDDADGGADDPPAAKGRPRSGGSGRR